MEAKNMLKVASLSLALLKKDKFLAPMTILYKNKKPIYQVSPYFSNQEEKVVLQHQIAKQVLLLRADKALVINDAHLYDRKNMFDNLKNKKWTGDAVLIQIVEKSKTLEIIIKYRKLFGIIFYSKPIVNNFNNDNHQAFALNPIIESLRKV